MKDWDIPEALQFRLISNSYINIFMQDVHFNITYIPISVCPFKVKCSTELSYKKDKNGLINVKMFCYKFFKYIYIYYQFND